VAGTCYKDGLTENCQTSCTNWKPIDGRRCPVRLRTEWQHTGEVDIRGGGINWEQIPDLAVDRGAWRELTALVLLALEELRSKV